MTDLLDNTRLDKLQVGDYVEIIADIVDTENQATSWKGRRGTIIDIFPTEITRFPYTVFFKEDQRTLGFLRFELRKTDD